MRDCIKRIVEKSKGTISADVAKELLKQVDRDAKKLTAAGVDYNDAVENVLIERSKNTKENILKQKANIARNVIIKARNNNSVSGLIDGGLSVMDAFRADLEGIESPLPGARDSLDIQKTGVENAYFSKFIGRLNEENLLQILNSKTMDDEIGRELYALSNGEKNVTGNKQAARIAEIAHETLDGQVNRLNAAGADIQKLPGYVMPQRHDIDAMVKLGEDGWANRLSELVDESRSFGGDFDNLFDPLRGAYKALVTGIRLNDPTIKDSKLFQFSGPSNLGKKLSESRVIHFKDYESWKAWNSELGSKDLNEGLIEAIHYNSKNIALMERYGTNPEAMMRATADDIKKKYRDNITESGEKFNDAKLDDIIDHAVGNDLIAANPTTARYGANIRVFNNVTSLGGALLSSMTDIPLKSLEYKFQGKTWLSSTVQPFMDIAQGFKSKKDRIEFASMTGVGMESMISDIGGRFSSQDTLTNRAAKVQRQFFKLNGLAWWTDSHKNAMSRVMSHHLGLKKDLPIEGLDADTKRLFGNYRIGAKEWDTMRAAVTTLEDGRAYILPEKIKDQKIKEKLISYYADRINSGVVTPTARERRVLTLGTQRGTGVGEAVRLMAQFKSFPVTTITKVWGRALYGKGKADVPAMLYLMLNTMAFGYMVGAAKDMLKGRTPKDPTKLETAYASLAQGGGAGILADVLLQDATFGRSFTSAMAGPTFSRIDDVFKIYSASIRGKGGAAQALKTGASMVPFNNLFYVRPAIDQLLLLPIQEDLNPGYLRRMEQSMDRTYGQRLMFQ